MHSNCFCLFNLQFTEKWFHGIIVSERKGYCEAIFLRGREAEWEVI